MEAITIAWKTWKPQKKDPSKTYLSIKGSNGKWYNIFDVGVGMALDKLNEGDTVNVQVTENKGFYNITAVGDRATTPSPATTSRPAPIPENDGAAIGNALNCLTAIATAECTPEPIRDSILEDILPMLRRRAFNGTSKETLPTPLPSGGSPPVPESDEPEPTSEPNPIVDEAVKIFKQMNKEQQFNSLKSLAKDLSQGDDQKMIKAIELIEKHVEKGTAHELYLKFKERQDELLGSEKIPF